MKKNYWVVFVLLMCCLVLYRCCLPFLETQKGLEGMQEDGFAGPGAILEEVEGVDGDRDERKKKISGGKDERERRLGNKEIEVDMTSVEDGAEIEDTVPKILHFVDVFGEEYQVKVNSNAEMHNYQLTAFAHEGDRLSYQGDEGYSYRLGVDVSYHNGYIDWKKVKSSGYEFAFLRIGYRGYGQAGNVCLDKQFFHNIKNAQAAGIDVGVYFFSQAINEEEAEEEAEFVIKNLEGLEIQLPVVYDPENILDDKARTDDVTGAQFTKNTIIFCKKIAEAGYQPMIYSNMLWEAFQFDMEQLSAYPVWYADYEPLPQTPYAFEYWQYSNEGIVDGIEGLVDLDIHLIFIND